MSSCQETATQFYRWIYTTQIAMLQNTHMLFTYGIKCTTETSAWHFRTILLTNFLSSLMVSFSNTHTLTHNEKPCWMSRKCIEMLLKSMIHIYCVCTNSKQNNASTTTIKKRVTKNKIKSKQNATKQSSRGLSGRF